MEFLFLVFLIIESVDVAGSTIMWDTPFMEVTQGDDVSFTCRITQLEMFDVVKTVLIKDGKALEISANEDLKPQFKNTGRYRLTLFYDGPAVNVTIRYNRIRGEDGGTLLCYVMSDPSVAVIARVRVLVPIKSVNLITIQNDQELEIPSGGTFDMIYGRETGIICVITIDGAHEAPNVFFTVQGIDVTHLFNRTENPVTLPRQYEALPGFSNTIRYSYITLGPNAWFNDKEIVFHVRGQLIATDHYMLNLFLNVYFKPVVTCDALQYYAQIECRTSMKCYVKSNPRATLAYMHSGWLGQYRQLEKRGPYKTKEKKISRDITEIHVDVYGARDEQFGKYLITAVNAYGQGSAILRLSKEIIKERTEMEKYAKENVPAVRSPKYNSGANLISLARYYLVASSISYYNTMLYLYL